MLLRIATLSAIIAVAILTQTDIMSVRAQPEAIAASTPLAATDASTETPMARDPSSFIIAGGDGYGATECLATTGQCGQIVADAWCESKGYAKSLAYRRAAKDETTASVGRTSGNDAFVITCSADK